MRSVTSCFICQNAACRHKLDTMHSKPKYAHNTNHAELYVCNNFCKEIANITATY